MFKCYMNCWYLNIKLLEKSIWVRDIKKGIRENDERAAHKYLNVTFFVKDARDLEDTISGLLKNKEVDGTYFKLFKDNTAFAQSAKALNNMRIITWILAVLILVGGIALLLL